MFSFLSYLISFNFMHSLLYLFHHCVICMSFKLYLAYINWMCKLKYVVHQTYWIIINPIMFWMKLYVKDFTLLCLKWIFLSYNLFALEIMMPLVISCNTIIWVIHWEASKLPLYYVLLPCILKSTISFYATLTTFEIFFSGISLFNPLLDLLCPFSHPTEWWNFNEVSLPPNRLFIDGTSESILAACKAIECYNFNGISLSYTRLLIFVTLVQSLSLPRGYLMLELQWSTLFAKSLLIVETSMKYPFLPQGYWTLGFQWSVFSTH